MTKLFAIASGITLYAGTALAQSKPPKPQPVPEIDVTTGIGAAILMLGIAALLWERRARS